MAISRRIFIKSGTLTAIAAGVATGANRFALGQRHTQGTSLGYQIPITSQQEETSLFTRATFDPYVGSIFQTPNLRGRMVSLTLLSVTPYQVSAQTKLSTAITRETDSFSLKFAAASALPELTSIHKISHPALGTFDLFLEPHSGDSKERIYEAVFNHI